MRYSMSKELKQCPFCGGKAKKEAKEINGIKAVYVMCNKCGASSGVYRTYNPRVKDEENPAIRAWNRRTTDE
jgi:Lar family restriction alleviation protein